jgi:protein O-mannosyl-transferase
VKPAKKRSPAARASSPDPVPKVGSRHLLAAAALCILTLLAFANSFSAGFPLDNKGLILQDTRVHAATRENIDQILQHSYWYERGPSGLYRPLTTLSYLFNYAVLGDGENPAGYHWVNLLLHLLNVLLVYLVGLKLFREWWPAVSLAALWAVHPLLTESVTNIIGRADLIAGGAVLGGFLLYLKSAEATGPKRFAWLAALMATTAVGVFSKESAVILPGVIVLYEITWWKDRRSALILGCIAVLVPLQAMMYNRSLALAADGPSDFPFTDNPLTAAGFWQAKLTAVKVMAHYLGLALWPARLSTDYSYNQIPIVHGSAADWVCCILVVALAAAALWFRRRQRTAFFLASFAFLTLLPASNLLFPIGTIMAERLFYLPLIGVLACLVLALDAAARRFQLRWLLPAVVTVGVLGFGARTWARNLDWRDDITLARASASSAPDSFKTHRMLAEALYAADPEHSNLSEIIREAEKSVAILDPLPDSRSNPETYRFAGDCYLTEGDRLQQERKSTVPPPESMEDYRKALTVLKRGVAILEASRQSHLAALRAEGKPESLLGTSADEDLYRLLAGAYFRLGDGDHAFDAAMESRRREPLNPIVYRQLGHILFAAHQVSDAATVLMEGMLVTSDMGLRQQLMDLYRSGLDTQGCAIANGPYGAAINPKCPLVHENLCSAGLDALRIRLATGQTGPAADLKKNLLQDYGCPAGPIEQVLPDSAGSQ